MKKLVSLVLVAALSFGLAGCATEAGTGAGIGATLGAIVGAVACKGKAKCIAMGAAIGGLTGLAIGSYRDKQLADRNAALANYNNAQTHDDHNVYVENNQIKKDFLSIEKSEATPDLVKKGGEITTAVQYTLLSQYADEKNIKITEKRYMMVDGDEIVISNREITSNQGTKASAYKFKVPDGVEPGNYQVVTEVSGLDMVKKSVVNIKVTS